MQAGASAMMMGGQPESPALLIELKGLKPESTNCASSLSTRVDVAFHAWVVWCAGIADSCSCRGVNQHHSWAGKEGSTRLNGP